MSIRTRLHIAGEPSVAHVVQEYLTSYRPPMNILVGRMFRHIYRHHPELPRTFMHEVNQDQLTEEILASGCDGVLISCGPGNPNDYPEIVKTVKALMEAKPVMGVGTGHLMMALGVGCKITKMLYGHHGSNQPVKDFARGTCAVTSQAIGYAVDGGNERWGQPKNLLTHKRLWLFREE